MTIISNGTTLSFVTYNGTALTKVICNVVTVWKDRILHIGNFYVMGSNSVLSSFSASRPDNNTLTAYGSSYQAFNNGGRCLWLLGYKCRCIYTS